MLILLVWRYGRREAQYFWFGVSCLSLAVFSSYLTLRDIDLPGGWVRWAAHVSLDAWIASFILFVRRYMGQGWQPRERWLVAYVLAASIATAPHGLVWQGHACFVSHAVGGLVLVIVMCSVFAAWRRYPQLALALLVLIVAGLHDLVVGIPVTDLPEEFVRMRLKYHFFVFHYVALATLLFMTIHLAQRFIRALNEVAVLNRELESRVATQSAALQTSYEERARLAHEQAAQDERERIYRDLHDDVGAHLVSLVIRAQNPADAETARAALQNLRDVVSQSVRGDQLLLDLIADWRAEIAGRVTDANLEFVWRQAEDIPRIVIGSATALNLTRILREAVSNVLKHAQARRLSIDIARAGGNLRFAITDDGQGMDGASRSGQHNMLARAQALGGVLQWLPAAPGCVVELLAPVAALRKEASPSG